MSTVKNFTEATFKQEVLESDRPVLVDFWASWCGPCRKLVPVIDAVAEEIGEKAVVGKVNLDEERTLGAVYQIMSIPCLMVFHEGKKVEEMVGIRPAAEIVAALRKYV